MEIRFIIDTEKVSLDCACFLRMCCVEAVGRGFSISRCYRTILVNVPDWPAWLSVMWHVYAQISRGSCRDAMYTKFPFLVEFEGRLFRTFVVYDDSVGGIRYGMGE